MTDKSQAGKGLTLKRKPFTCKISFLNAMVSEFCLKYVNWYFTHRTIFSSIFCTYFFHHDVIKKSIHMHVIGSEDSLKCLAVMTHSTATV